MNELPRLGDAPLILCAGIAVQDIVMRVDRFPLPGHKVPASDYVTIGGGCSANSAVAVARLGGQTRFSGPLGGLSDSTSNNIVSGLQGEGIDCAGVVRVAGASASVSLILLDAQGEKTIATRRGENLDKAEPANAGAQTADISALLIDNRFPAFVTPLARAARQRRIPVVIDFDQQTTADDPLLSYGTHIVASSEALCASTGQDDPRNALVALSGTLGCFLGVTDGPNGVYWMAEGSVRHLPGFKVDAIDTLGAGDVFHGAFVYALAQGQNEVAAMKFGAAAAAIKCTRFGGMTGAPGRAEVEDFLRHAGEPLFFR